jgi:hypothetical protein
VAALVIALEEEQAAGEAGAVIEQVLGHLDAEPGRMAASTREVIPFPPAPAGFTARPERRGDAPLAAAGP